MDFQTILYEVDDQGIATITLNRPDKLNALNTRLLDELDTAIRQARADRRVSAVILTGAGQKSFAAGADITQFTELDALSGHRFALKGQAVFNRIEDMPKVVIAAVNGYALGGGCELALACHLRIASENAMFGQPEVNLGIIPGYGGTQRLPRLVGRGIATEIMLTGDYIPASRAYEMGLVNHVVPQQELMAKAREIALKIASKAPIAISMVLDAIRHSDLPLKQGLRLEAALFGHTCATEDFREGVQAFLERRKPEFKGK